MRRTLAGLSIGVAIASLISLAGCTAAAPQASNSSSSKVSTVRIAENNTSGSLLIEVAKQEGFFANHGIDAQTTVLNDITVIPSLLGKQYDVGFSVAPIIVNAASSGVDIAAISGNDAATSVVGTELVARKGITSASQLKGMRVGTPTLTGNLNLLTKAWLQSHGVDPTSVQYVQVATPNMIDQLKAGQIDAAEVQNPFITQAKGEGMTMLGGVDYALSKKYIGQSFWAADGAWAKANPAVVTRFRAALSDAAAWIASHKEKAYAVIADFTKVDIAVAKKAPIGNYGVDITPSEFKLWIAAMKKYNGFGGSVDPNALVVTGK